MSGGRARAESGELTFMASGAPTAFAAAESILSATSAKVFRLGEAPGIGSLVKTVNQLLAGVHIATAAEAMALAAKAGADTRAVYEVISASAGNSWMFGNRVPHMLDDDYSPLSAVEIFVKDLGLVLDTGHELRLPLPLAAAAHQLFLAAAGAGWGKLDDAAVVKVYEQAGDFKVSSRQALDWATCVAQRFTKIVATLGPAVLQPGAAEGAVRGGRRRLPPQLQPRHAGRPQAARRPAARAGEAVQAPDRHPDGPAGPQAAARHAGQGTDAS